MTSLATTKELEAYVGSVPDPTRAQQFLDMASEVIRSRIGDLAQVEDDTVTLDGGSSYLFLQGPVTELTSITVDGTLVDPENYVWNAAGTVRGLDGYVFGATSSIANVVVVYTHGYTAIPDDIRTVCLNIAARAITNEGDSILSGGIPEARGWGPEIRLRPEEENLLSAYAPIGIG